MACTKALTLDNTVVPPPCFYYKMQVIGGVSPADYIPNEGMLDMATSLFLHGGSTLPAAPIGPAVGIAPSGVIGNCALSRANAFWAGQICRTHTLVSDGVPPATSNLLKLANRSWTMRFWIKHTTAAPGTTDSKYLLGVRWVGVNDGIRLFRVNLGNWNYENYYRLRIVPAAGAEINLLSAIVPSNTGQTWQLWHRVVITFNHTTQTATIQINNDAPVSQTVPGFTMINDPLTVEMLSYQALTVFYNYYLDEFLFLPDAAWSLATSTYDWNGGVGRTYPDIHT